MNGRPEILAVIPARAGSKGIEGKNIRSLGGKPLIAWTIEAARASKQVSRTIVSTDSHEIAETARRFGAEIPFLRPADLAQDDTPGVEPPLHALKWFHENEKYVPDLLLLLQPTSPLRTTQDIDDAVTLLGKKDADSVISVTPSPCHPYWMKCLDRGGRLTDFIKLNKSVTRRQDLPAVYILNGAIYLIRRNVFLQRRDWYTDKTYAFVMPRERSFDIDGEWDLRLVEKILDPPLKRENQ